MPDLDDIECVGGGPLDGERLSVFAATVSDTVLLQDGTLLFHLYELVNGEYVYRGEEREQDA